MRNYYLHQAHTKSNACRGAVSNQRNDDYELEIGSDLHASPEMVALCVLHDEIIEHLQNSKSHLGSLILHQYEQIIEAIRQKLKIEYEQSRSDAQAAYDQVREILDKDG